MLGFLHMRAAVTGVCQEKKEEEEEEEAKRNGVDYNRTRPPRVLSIRYRHAKK